MIQMLSRESQDIAQSGWIWILQHLKLCHFISFGVKSSVAQNFYGHILRTKDGTLNKYIPNIIDNWYTINSADTWDI